jgi:hypothetical protein
MHDPMIELATVPATPRHPAVPAARPVLGGAVADLLTVPDETLKTPWRWRATDPVDNELRYGAYRIVERLEEAIRAIELARGSGAGAAIGPAIPALGVMAAARWDLHGVLAPLPSDVFDADPGGGEWTIRRTVGHVIGSQRSYAWYNAWYISHPRPVEEVVRPADGTLPPEPSEDDDGAGTLDEVGARLDEVVDATIRANAALDRAALELGARWSGVSVTIDFRLGRYGSHIREHTIQVEKTLELLGRQPTEIERLVRLILGTYGRLEALLVGRPPDVLAQPFADGTDAPAVLTAAVADIAETAAWIRAAAG